MTAQAILPEHLESAVDTTLAICDSEKTVERLWRRDPSLWTGTTEAQWLGWLDIVDEQIARLDDLKAFAAEVRAGDYSSALLLGMGGSSLCPEVLKLTFGRQPGFPALEVLDSTDPAQVRAVANRIDPARSLFIVSSKSGSTLEPNVFLDYFYSLAGRDGARFIAITDPGSSMQKEAERRGFGRIFAGVPSIGGRYSALSNFGLAPAAAAGLDLDRFLARAKRMVEACKSPSGYDNPGVTLGAVLACAANAGRDKLTLIVSPGIQDLGAWLEQLVAESTGKAGIGIIPVDREAPGRPAVYGRDRLFVYIRLSSGADAAQDAAVDALQRAGHPVVRIPVAEIYDLGGEFFRWEIATAIAGAILGINPFDQPDVESSKVATRALTSEFEKSGAFPAEQPAFTEGDIAVYGPTSGGTLADSLRAQLDTLRPGDYFAVLAYIERNEAHERAIQRFRTRIRDAKRVATCLGFGPRFLHSTGQAYKGGPNTGVFLQITCDDAEDLAIPGRAYSFGVVKAAQARGDFEVLRERGRRALRVHLKGDVRAGLEKLGAAVERVLR